MKEKDYAILRISKLKSMTSVYGYARHNNRTNPAEEFTGVRPELSHKNKLSGLAGKGNDDIKSVYAERLSLLKRAPRPNAVQGIDIVITASPEFFDNSTDEEHSRFFEKSTQWIADNFGGHKNIIASWIHYDEETPHMHIIVYPECPLGRLNTKHFLGGNKNRFTEYQTSFAKSVEELGLERGEFKSKAIHQTVRQFHKDTVFSLKEEKSAQEKISNELILQYDHIANLEKQKKKELEEIEITKQKTEKLNREAQLTRDANKAIYLEHTETLARVSSLEKKLNSRDLNSIARENMASLLLKKAEAKVEEAVALWEKMISHKEQLELMGIDLGDKPIIDFTTGLEPSEYKEEDDFYKMTPKKGITKDDLSM